MISLVGTFLNSEGNQHTFTFKNPDTTKSADEIKESLGLLASLDLFEKDGIGLFQKVVKAKYVEKIERPIFEGTKLFGEPLAAQEPATAIQLPEPAPLFFRSQSQTALNQHLQPKEEEPESQTELPAALTIETKQKLPAPAGSFYTRTKEKLFYRINRKIKAKGREAPPDPS